MESRCRVLVVDDEPDLRAAVAATFAEASRHDCVVAADGVEALERVKQGDINLVLTDLMMPRMDGARLLQELRRFNPEIPVMMMTSHGSIDSAVGLLRNGAYDYITKPFKMEELLQRVGNALEKLELLEEVKQLRSLTSQPRGTQELVGRSEAMVRMLKQLPSIARSDASVIILGESGTGKEVVARAIHTLSPRAARPFVPVHCGALPESLLENELFGHARGAYTDARADYAGLFKEADTGTLFLDEVSEISVATQVKLLRFLQEKEYRPLGSTRTQKVSVRVVSASNKDLKRAIAEDKFREDLYYRLNIIPITLPPLRERKEDIPLLVSHFLARIRREFDHPVESFSPLAMQKLMSYDWPGNIRELENKVQALSETSIILPQQVEFGGGPLLTRATGELKSFKQAKREIVDAFEVSYLARLLSLNQGNISHAARHAGKHRRAFWELMKKHNLTGKRQAPPPELDEVDDPIEVVAEVEPEPVEV